MKRLTRLSLLVAAAALLPLASAAAPSAAAAAQRDWTKTVVATPEGGFRIGNPEAPVKLVEYGSLTCSHCAHFGEEGVPALLGNYVKSGKVSFEFRNFVRDAFDLTGAMLSRCAGAGNFFPLSDRILATQAEWIGKAQALGQAERDAIRALPLAGQLARIAAATGLDKLANAHGVPADKVSACLSNETAVDRLTEMHRVAVEQHGVQGTPGFLINGRVASGVHDWAALEPLLVRPGG